MQKKEPEHKYKHIMLIDDSELDNFINQKMIEVNHFAEHIYINTSPAYALEFLHNLQVTGGDKPDSFPEVIFVDLNMPVMDGFQFIAAFKKNSLLQKVKPRLVILTSSVSPRDKMNAAELDREIVFLNKPLNKEMLDSI